jgi:hypothetical protein
LVAGGEANLCKGVFAAAYGGSENVAGGVASAVIAGAQNEVAGAGALVAGGRENHAEGDGAILQGGVRNQLKGSFSASVGGMENEVEGLAGVSIAGRGNHVGAQAAVAIAGSSNSLHNPQVLTAGGSDVEGRDPQHVYVAGLDLSRPPPPPVIVERSTVASEAQPRFAAVARAGTLLGRRGSVAEITAGMRGEYGVLGFELRAGALHRLQERMYGFSLSARADVPFFADGLQLFIEPAFRNVAIAYGGVEGTPLQHVGAAFGLSYRLFGDERSTHRLSLSAGVHGGAERRETSTVDALRERTTLELRPELGFVMAIGWEVLP